LRVLCFVGRGLCDRMITRLEESIRMWSECDLETLQGGGLGPRELSRNKKR
jgi:hypothetical protein